MRAKDRRNAEQLVDSTVCGSRARGDADEYSDLKSRISAHASKHAAVISVFDKGSIHTGKLDTRLSKQPHKTFEARQTIDYREMVAVAAQEATMHVRNVRGSVAGISTVISAAE